MASPTVNWQKEALGASGAFLPQGNNGQQDLQLQDEQQHLQEERSLSEQKVTRKRKRKVISCTECHRRKQKVAYNTNALYVQRLTFSSSVTVASLAATARCETKRIFASTQIQVRAQHNWRRRKKANWNTEHTINTPSSMSLLPKLAALVMQLLMETTRPLEYSIRLKATTVVLVQAP